MVYDLRKPNEFIRIEVDVVGGEPAPKQTKSVVRMFIKSRGLLLLFAGGPRVAPPPPPPHHIYLMRKSYGL
jgi:hypothetical protein